MAKGQKQTAITEKSEIFIGCTQVVEEGHDLAAHVETGSAALNGDGKEQIMVKNEKFSDFAIDLFFPIQSLNIDWGGEVANLYDSSRISRSQLFCNWCGYMPYSNIN
ncbi:predicted protein [Scheffersomyces stipitis CBS 6054]|uniref:Uncharacterized protein n=1 Tax=Scheffersomyces stipitis (strain ATCC 58785 / CBS 6054 / NBRC 10063 / NRRL Y-11545) TaxID=322104 RepID=A3LNY5_PICST|nr:predicted protein [Scheffersomyces stipitis CBS 6054]ABN64952.2 predicted protein [Scheffersomyces stipitis CBS 6054]